MYKKTYIFRLTLIFVAGLLWGACNKTSENLNNDVVVKVNNAELTVGEVVRVIPEGVSSRDSFDISQKYVQKWITRELITQKAIFNVGANDPEINKLVRDYKNSLVVKKYKEQLLERKADITPDSEEIKKYYQANAGKYMLGEDIFQGVIMKIPSDAPHLKELREWLKNGEDEDYSEIEGYCYQHALMFDDFREKWIAVDLVEQIMPDGFNRRKKVLENSAFTEQADSLNSYFLKVTNFKLKNDTAPQVYVEQNIITLLRHKKKLEFFSTFEKDIYNEGIKDETVIYNPKYE